MTSEHTLAASAAAGDQLSGDTSATAVQVESDVDPEAFAPGVEAEETADRPVRASGRLRDLVQARRDVARLEDVLTVAPTDAETSIAPPAAPETSIAPPAAPETSIAPPAASGLATTYRRVADLVQARREIARLDLQDVLSGALTDVSAPSAESASEAEIKSASGPEYVPANELREAFWFELAPAVESVPPPAPVEDQEPASPVSEPAPAAPESTQATSPVFTAGAEPTPAPQNNWLTAICLLLLVALVVALTGRNPRRSAS